MGLSLSTLDWTIGGAALVANILFGLWLALRARKSTGSDEFFLAGAGSPGRLSAHRFSPRTSARSTWWVSVGTPIVTGFARSPTS